MTQTFVRLNQKIIKGLNIHIHVVNVMIVNVCFDIIKSILLIDIELVSKELNHFGVIADLFRQIGGHSSRYFALFEDFSL